MITTLALDIHAWVPNQLKLSKLYWTPGNIVFKIPVKSKKKKEMKNITKFFQYWYFQYTLYFGLIVLEPMEVFIFSIL